MEIKLKECPFCGQAAALRTHTTRAGSIIVFTKCTNCEASTKAFWYESVLPDGSKSIEEKSMEKAAAAWNNRVQSGGLEKK